MSDVYLMQRLYEIKMKEPDLDIAYNNKLEKMV